MTPAKSVRVLHILQKLRPSGAEVMLKVAAPLWFQDGSAHSVLATGATIGPYADLLRNAGFHVFHIPFAKRIGFFAKVYALLRKEQFDAVHIHTEQANVFYAMLARLAGVRSVVHTIHNVFPYTGLLRLVRIAMRMGIRSLRVTPVAIGDSVAWNERKHLWNRTVITIPNWYDDSVFRPPTASERANARRHYNLRDQERVLVTLGNCNGWKNHNLLLQALPLLLERNQDWIYLHGGIEDEDKREQSLAAELKVTQHCRFLGSIANPQSLLWAADVFVMPSLQEGLGNAAVEAAACNLPLALTDVPGLCDLRRYFSQARWVSPADPAFLADAIEDLYAQPLSTASGSNATDARAFFAVRIGASCYAELYAGHKPHYLSSHSPAAALTGGTKQI